MAMFTLEWKYSLNFLYELATEMVDCKVTTIPDLERRIVAFAGRPNIYSDLLFLNPNLLSDVIHAESRMLILRRKYIHDIINCTQEEFEIEIKRYTEALVVVSWALTYMTYEKEMIKEWFLKHTDEDDWASVFSLYNIFQVHVSNKQWPNKKIRYIKEIINCVGIDYKNPEFRS